MLMLHGVAATQPGLPQHKATNQQNRRRIALRQFPGSLYASCFRTPFAEASSNDHPGRETRDARLPPKKCTQTKVGMSHGRTVNGLSLRLFIADSCSASTVCSSGNHLAFPLNQKRGPRWANFRFNGLEGSAPIHRSML